MQRLIIVAAMVLVLVGGPLSLECWGCGGGGEGGSYSFGGDEGLEGLTGPGGVTGPPNGGPTISRRSFYGYSWGPKFNFYTTATGDLGPLRAYDTFRPMQAYGYTPTAYLLQSGQGDAYVQALAETIGAENMNYLADAEAAMSLLASLIQPDNQQYPQVMLDSYFIRDELSAALAEAGLQVDQEEMGHGAYWVRVDSIDAEAVNLTVSMEHFGWTIGQAPIVVPVARDRFQAAWTATGPDDLVPIRFGPCYMMVPQYSPTEQSFAAGNDLVGGFKEMLPQAASAPGFMRRLVSALQAGLPVPYIRGGESYNFGPSESPYMAARMLWARRGTATVLSDLGYANLASGYDQLAEDWAQLASCDSTEALITFFNQIAQQENEATAAVLAEPVFSADSVRGAVISTSDPSGAFVSLTQSQNPADPPVATSVIRNPNGEFILAQVPAGTYYLIAWRDANFNDGYDPGEALGYYLGAVTLNNGGQVSGLSLTLP